MRRRDRRCRTRKGPSQPDRAGDASEAAASRGMSGSAYRQHLPVRGEVPRDPSCRGMRLALAAGARRWRRRVWRVGMGPCYGWLDFGGGCGVGKAAGDCEGGVVRPGRASTSVGCLLNKKRTSQPSLRSVGHQLGMDVVWAKLSSRICVGDRGQGGSRKSAKWNLTINLTTQKHLIVTLQNKLQNLKDLKDSWYAFTHPNRATHYPLYTSLCAGELNLSGQRYFSLV